MDVSTFMTGNYLTQADLPAQPQAWTIRDVQQQLVGTDQKICLHFAEHPKPLGANKTNLRTIAAAYGTDAAAWIGRPLELYRDQTTYQGRIVPCVRVRVPQADAPMAQAPVAQQPVAITQPPTAPVQAPVAAQPQPVAIPQPPAAAAQPQAPWEQDDSNPPGA